MSSAARRLRMRRGAQGLDGRGIRRANLLSVLSLLRDGAPRSTPELGAELHLDPSTVVRLLARLQSLGLVRGAGVAADGTVGRPPKVWQLRSSVGCVLGLSIDLHRVDAIVAGLDGRSVAQSCVDETERPEPRGVVEAVGLAVDRLREGGLGAPLLAAGASVPGVVEADTGLLLVGGPFGWADSGVLRNVAIGEQLERRLGCPVLVGNDANVAAAAVFAVAAHADELAPGDSLAYCLAVARHPLWWGALGFVINGRVHVGSHSAAGELFYHRPPTPEIDDATGDDASRAVRGDLKAARRIMHIVRPNVHYMVSLTAPVDPQRIVFGGSYTAMGAVVEEVFQEIETDMAGMHPWLPGFPHPELMLDPLWPKTLELGAARMAIDRLLDPATSGEWDLFRRLSQP